MGTEGGRSDAGSSFAGSRKAARDRGGFDRETEVAGGARAYRGHRGLSQRSALRERRLPPRVPGGPRARVRRRGRAGRRRGHLREARRPRHHLPVRLLRRMRVLPGRAHVALSGAQGAGTLRGTAQHRGGAGPPVREPVLVRGADDRARTCPREAPRGYALRSGRPSSAAGSPPGSARCSTPRAWSLARPSPSSAAAGSGSPP